MHTIKMAPAKSNQHVELIWGEQVPCSQATGKFYSARYLQCVRLPSRLRGITQSRQRPGSSAIFGRLRTDDCVAPRVLVKAAVHFARATTCLTRSLSMFRLVGVGSRPDLLAVVVCAKSTKLAVTLAQGGNTSSGPLVRNQCLAEQICTGARPLSGRSGG